MEKKYGIGQSFAGCVFKARDNVDRPRFIPEACKTVVCPLLLLHSLTFARNRGLSPVVQAIYFMD